MAASKARVGRFLAIPKGIDRSAVERFLMPDSTILHWTFYVVKTLHVGAAFAWIGGLLLWLWQAAGREKPTEAEALRSARWVITTMAITLVTGLWLLGAKYTLIDFRQAHWMHAKYTFVFLLILLTGRVTCCRAVSQRAAFWRWTAAVAISMMVLGSIYVLKPLLPQKKQIQASAIPSAAQ
ncbi:MAG: hypothetical protein ACOYKZ_04425 [Chlamydiia bacterium]